MTKKEAINKIKKCKSVDEVISLAKENNINLTKIEAEHAFKEVHQAQGKLNDNELNNVAGGSGCKERVSYSLQYFPTKESVQFMFKVGDIVEAFVSKFFDMGSRTNCVIIRELKPSQEENKLWIDKYIVDYYDRDSGDITDSGGMTVDREDIERS